MISHETQTEIVRLLEKYNGITIQRDGNNIVANMGQLHKIIGTINGGEAKCGVNLVA